MCTIHAKGRRWSETPIYKAGQQPFVCSLCKDSFTDHLKPTGRCEGSLLDFLNSCSLYLASSSSRVLYRAACVKANNKNILDKRTYTPWHSVQGLSQINEIGEPCISHHYLKVQVTFGGELFMGLLQSMLLFQF